MKKLKQLIESGFIDEFRNELISLLKEDKANYTAKNKNEMTIASDIKAYDKCESIIDRIVNNAKLDYQKDKLEKTSFK